MYKVAHQSEFTFKIYLIYICCSCLKFNKWTLFMWLGLTFPLFGPLWIQQTAFFRVLLSDPSSSGTYKIEPKLACSYGFIVYKMKTNNKIKDIIVKANYLLNGFTSNE